MCEGPGVSGDLDRREVIRRALAIPALAVLFAGCATLPPEALASRDVRFDTPTGKLGAYFARPKSAYPVPAILIAHGVIGQPDYQRAIADELASAGFAALTIDRFSNIPGFGYEALNANLAGPKRFLSEMFFREEQGQLAAALVFLGAQPGIDDTRFGFVGFCGGGIHGVRLASSHPSIKAVVSFYGPPRLPAQYRHPSDPIRDMTEFADRLEAPLQIHYGSDDYAVPQADVDALVAHLRARGKSVEAFRYAGARHGFYQTPESGDVASVAAARARYIAFLRRELAP